MHGLSEREANSLISRLSDSGIEAEKLAEGKDTWSVRVEQSVAARAIKIISRVHSAGNELAEEEQNGFFLSREDRKFNLARLLARDIEQTLLVLSGVREAKVHLNFPVEDPLLAGLDESSGDQQPNVGSGSALIIVENDSLYKKEDIANLVSGASGIPADFISVWITIDKVGEVDEKFEIKFGSSVPRAVESPASKPVKSMVVVPSGGVESFLSLAFGEIAGCIQKNLSIFIGVVLLFISIIILSWIRMNRLKEVSAVIPSYIP